MKATQRGGVIFKLVFLLVLLGLLGLLYLVRHPLLRLVGESWVVNQTPAKADAIIVLSDDNYAADRVQRAAELFRAGWAPRVVASGRMLRPYASIADLMQRDLVERGVPAGAVVRFTHRADDTFEEAQALRGLVVEHGWHRVLVVTSNYHTRRSAYIFRKVLPAEVEERVAAAQDFRFNPDRWWETRAGPRLFVHEVAGYCAAWWDLRHAAGGVAPDAPRAPAPTGP